MVPVWGFEKIHQKCFRKFVTSLKCFMVGFLPWKSVQLLKNYFRHRLECYLLLCLLKLLSSVYFSQKFRTKRAEKNMIHSNGEIFQLKNGKDSSEFKYLILAWLLRLIIFGQWEKAERIIVSKSWPTFRSKNTRWKNHSDQN